MVAFPLLDPGPGDVGHLERRHAVVERQLSGHAPTGDADERIVARQIDDLAKTIPDFYFGRFDVHFSSLAQLQLGKGFTVIEYNGGGSEATHIWDADTPLSAAYRDLFRQVRLLFEFGAANRSNGHKPAPWHQILGAWYREGRLKRRYPINQ